MKMTCRNCGRKMGLWEFLTYIETYFIKLVAAASIPFLIAAIKDRLSREKGPAETRGIIDESMAGLANNFAIACPGCKRADEPWDPVQDKKSKKINQENETVVP